MVRRFLVTVGFLCGWISGAVAADKFWISGDGQNGPTAGLVGCRECDDIALWLECDRATKSVDIVLFSNHLKAEPKKPKQRRVVFQIDDRKISRLAAVNFDQMNEAWLPTVRVNLADPVVNQLVKGKTLSIEIDGQTSDLSLDGAGEHLKKLRGTCW